MTAEIPWGLLAANLLILDTFFDRLELNNGINDPSLQSPQTEERLFEFRK